MADYTINKLADNVWVAASKIIATPGDTTHYVVKLPANVLILDIIVNKTVAYSLGSALVTIGFVGNDETADPDAFMSAATFDPTAVEVVSMRQGNIKNSGGKYCTQKSIVTVTSDDDGGTAGTFQIFVHYVQIKN